MTHPTSEHGVEVTGHRGIQYIVGIVVVTALSNLNAIVDAILHPDIPYFDKEHVVVGGITGVVSGMLVVLVMLYLRRLGKAVEKIRALESILPLCSYCRRTRRPGADPDSNESWLPLDEYIRENTHTHFSHGVCPECLPKYISGVAEKKDGLAEPNKPSGGEGK